MTARFHLERRPWAKPLSGRSGPSDWRTVCSILTAYAVAGIALCFDSTIAAAQDIAWSLPAAPPAERSFCADDRWRPLHPLPLRPDLAPDLANAAASPAGGEPQPAEPFPTNVYQAPWSRIGLGADVSPLGVGMKASTILNTYMDLRVDGNFFHYDVGRFEVDGVNVEGQVHLASAAAKIDVYPWLNIWRVSAGVMFINGNHLYAATRIASATAFSLDGKTYYSANANPATGAAPVSGSGTFGLHRRQPAFVLSGGFGRFIPRSERHWSFPSEFGVVFMGAPTVNVSLNGSVCTDKALTQCGNLANPSNPVTAGFNNSLQAALTKWRHEVGSFTLYPVFSYSVVYSFDTPGR